jgi:hypothetical protein
MRMSVSRRLPGTRFVSIIVKNAGNFCIQEFVEGKNSIGLPRALKWCWYNNSNNDFSAFEFEQIGDYTICERPYRRRIV